MTTDLVVAWVDGSDPRWQAKRQAYDPRFKDPSLSGAARFRDSGTLKYLFRSIEAYAPWIRKVHLIVDEQLPAWLETSSPRLQVVEHRTIFANPTDLPCFNSAAIQLHAPRIPDLAEQFLLFDDDFLLLNSTEEEDFFRDGKPVDFVKLLPRSTHSPFHQKWTVCNDLTFRKLPLPRKLRLALDPRYGAACLARNLHTMATRRPDDWNIAYFHCCQPYLKSAFEEAWRSYSEAMRRTSSHKFREPDDINHYLVRFHQIATGRFVPGPRRRYLDILLSEKVDVAHGQLEEILTTDAPMGCINENERLNGRDLDLVLAKQFDVLETKFPKRSAFEKS